jgi:hypothetical protein
MSTTTWTTSDLGRRQAERRAVEAAIWGAPLVSVHAMREAFFRDANATYNDIVFWSRPPDWKNQLATPCACSPCVYFNFNTKTGPVVLELPAADGSALSGTLLDAWQQPLVDVGPKGEDKGCGGRYLILPPDFDERVPAGCIPVHCATYNGYALLRVVPVASDAPSGVRSERASELILRQRLYPLARAAHPPAQRFIDMTGRLFDGVVRYDGSFYTRLARMIQEEPVQTRDLVAMGQIRSLGIDRQHAFAPGAELQSILRTAALTAHAEFTHKLLEEVTPWWPGSSWGFPRTTASVLNHGFSFQSPDCLDIDARAPGFCLASAAPPKCGDAPFQLAVFRDAKGHALQGGSRYRLHVPPDVPSQQVWAVTAYDLATGSFIWDSPRVGLDSSNERMCRESDGAVCLYFGAEPPRHQEENWIYTEPGRPWFAMFRFHGPTQALFERSWRLPDLEPLCSEPAT